MMEDHPGNVGHANMAPSSTIKEEPDSRPLPVTGTRYEDFESDGGYPTSRPGGYFMNRPTDLNVHEKFDVGNLRKWVKTEHPELYHKVRPEEINISENQRADSFCTLYKDCTSAADLEEMPSSPRPKTKDDTRIHVGKWNQYLPPSDNKRRRDEGDDNKSPTPSPKKPKKREEARLRGKPAYLAVGYSAGKGVDKVTSDYKDGSGQMATSQYIDWKSKDNIDQLKRRCLTKWKRNERTRIRQFNQGRILISSRNYIIEAAAAGTFTILQLLISPIPIIKASNNDKNSDA
ncbi:hypothetical protein Forpi1262_v004182 [Fusarium oxysporum f. sp. raphani]|uniref:Uncharacterized protein n=1 Tax=Fusarium oxysporum f. sp. raphani TaxID=96318 RepID=A0A8J5Q367_FUSOX|nr:hypothetical protein Forpi1262_v004182 [Fusarium oxysporum f. sp. raphani]